MPQNKGFTKQELSSWRELGLNCPEFWGLQTGEPGSRKLSYSSSLAPSRTRHPVPPARGPLLTYVLSAPWPQAEGVFSGASGAQVGTAICILSCPRQQALSQGALLSIRPRETGSVLYSCWRVSRQVLALSFLLALIRKAEVRCLPAEDSSGPRSRWAAHALARFPPGLQGLKPAFVPLPGF